MEQERESGKRIRVLVVDDHTLLREATREALEQHADLQVVGEAADGLEAVHLVQEVQPDVVLMDLNMPRMDGLEATRRIKTIRPNTVILVLTGSAEDESVFPLLEAGAAGYLLKMVRGSELASAVRAVARGESVLYPSITSKVLAHYVTQASLQQGAPQAARESGVVPEMPLLTDTEREQAIRSLAPEGTVSILFTDVEASTALFQALGDEAARTLLRTHDQMVREEVVRSGGYEVKHTGDGFMVVFSGARRALGCAIRIQQRLEASNQAHPATELRVRMGLNSGEALREAQDFFGTAVILAARLMGRGRGGQILVSELFRRLVGTTVSVKYRDLGRHKLHGFDQMHRVYEVDWRGSSQE